jgi:phosphoglycolate phosphatase-like HAD superfamily hydrolase
MTNSKEILRDLVPQKEYFIGIDSDGCAFDTMEIKQKECFCPNFIQFFALQSVSKYARETWEFVNLYSKSRGVNRFPALVEALHLLSERKEVHARNAEIIQPASLIEWIASESKLGNPALEKYVALHPDSALENVLKWSKAVNADIEKMVYGIAPFPFVRESLKIVSEKADIMVVSQTPGEALTREWKENKIDQFVRLIAGQEYGSKTEHVAYGAKGKYPDEKILVIGDANGDMKAARANGVLFYPINPGHEEDSWKRFHNEAFRRFIEGQYKGNYENSLVNEFGHYLPEHPPWDKE